MEGEGKEGDWKCIGCRNRNYAFRTFCNRCKQPRLLVDTKSTADYKWLPRIGDWICTDCTNNNYASRDNCKKCGKPKELASIPAIAMHGVSLRTHPHHFAMTQGVQEPIMNSALFGNGVLQLSLPLSSNWSLEKAHKYGNQQTSTWPFSGNASSGFPLANQANQLAMGPTGWRSGDWICNCGFHNYSSREQCKRCNASMPPVLGMKRLASEELVHDWGNKRMNVAQTVGMQCVYPLAVSGGNQTTGRAKQWRDGDWMCTNCNNHNYASRFQCNRCKTQKDASAQSVSVV